MGDEARKRGRASRNKGKRYEREVANFLKKVFPNATRGKSQSAHDATFRPDVDGLPDHWIECKHRKRVDLRGALLQGEEEANDGRQAVVFAKDDSVGGRKVEWVMMRPETFLDLCRKAYQCKDTEVAPCAESKLSEPPKDQHNDDLPAQLEGEILHQQLVGKSICTRCRHNTVCPVYEFASKGHLTVVSECVSFTDNE